MQVVKYNVYTILFQIINNDETQTTFDRKNKEKKMTKTTNSQIFKEFMFTPPPPPLPQDNIPENAHNSQRRIELLHSTAPNTSCNFFVA